MGGSAGSGSVSLWASLHLRVRAALQSVQEGVGTGYRVGCRAPLGMTNLCVHDACNSAVQEGRELGRGLRGVFCYGLACTCTVHAAVR